MLPNKRRYTRSILIKIVLTSLFAGGTIFMSIYLSKITFRKILTTVNQLSLPNAKMDLVNAIFRDVVNLDQQWRKEVYKNTHITSGNGEFFPAEHQALQQMLDSLRAMSLQNPLQVKRIDSMRLILDEKKVLFNKYIRMRTDIINNDTISKQVKKLSGLIQRAGMRMDSNVVTTSRNTAVVTDTLVVEEKQNLWKRIFNKKKKNAPVVQKKIDEVLKTRVDTLPVNKGGHAMADLGRAMARAEQNRLDNRNKLIAMQMELNQVNDVLLRQLVRILDDIENDEIQHDAARNVEAIATVNEGLSGINLIMFFFVVGTIVLIYMIFTDIARSNQYRNRLIEAREEAEEAGLVKQRFLANMSHELRTPLQAIIGISEQMKLQHEASDRQIDNVYQSARHLLQTVNEILDYSRIVSGNYTFDKVTFSVSDITDEVAEIIFVHADMRHLRFHYHNNTVQDVFHSGDAFRLKQILLNVLGNAVKFTSKGSVTLTVEQAADAGNTDMFTFTIADTGVGIAAADIEKIFNQFEQAHNHNSHQGTGLGLNIVRSLVQLQGGRVRVSSEPGKGSVFTITIPYPQTTAPVPNGLIPQSSLPAVPFNGFVWVVDDDAFILQLCDDILTKHHIPHQCFPSPGAALQAAIPTSLSTVILDIRMPEMSGTDLCRKLKARTTDRAPVFIALTAQVLPEEQEKIFYDGFDKLLLKPFVEETFIEVVTGDAPAAADIRMVELDMGVLKKMTGNNPALLRKSLDTFVHETEKDIIVMKDLVARGKPELIIDPIHKLAGRCGQFGAKDLSRELRMLEIDIRQHGISREIVADLPALYTRLGLLIATVKTVGN